MRNLKRNQVTIFYKNYLGKTEIMEDGHYTGEYEVTYSELKSVAISISANKGDVSSQHFGDLLDYDRTMITADTGLDITESSILWLDGADTSEAHNFIVKKVARSLNAIQYAIKQVTVS